MSLQILSSVCFTMRKVLVVALPAFQAGFHVLKERMSEQLRDAPTLLGILEEALCDEVLHFRRPALLYRRHILVNDRKQ